MRDNSFIENMAADWAPKSSKRNHKWDDWNWFFSDSDKDGVMNGIDCQPYNKRKQDNFPYLQANVPKYFNIPLTTNTNMENQTTPQQNQFAQ